MIIKDLRVSLLRLPFTDPPRWSVGYDRPRELVIVDIETVSGVTGMGYLMPLSGGLRTIATCIDELVKPHVLGRRLDEVEEIWDELWTANYMVGRMGVTIFAQSAVDIALWDARAKAAGQPLHRLWGHLHDDVPAYGSGCWRGLGREGMIEKARQYVDQGFTAIKTQVGHMYDADTDAGNIAAMRDALGPDIEIMVDANMAFGADEAIALGRRLDEQDIYWLEEPVVAEDIEGYFRVAEALETRVVGGENHFTCHEMKAFFANAKIPILQPDPMRGGLTDMRRVASAADAAGITIAPHLFPELMVQVLASIPNGHVVEYLDFLDDLWLEPVLPKAGKLRAPERPGHGLEFKPEIRAKMK
jgi:L-alanine-DL-glutamate epimerase-like enolase superfamily enzyme